MHRDRVTILAAVLAALALTAGLVAVDPIRDAVAAAFRGDLEAMREELDALGAAAALVLLGIALVHVVVPFPAEFPTAAAGFVLGFAVALPLMVFAWTISCVAAYLLARVLGPPVLERLAGEERMQRADRLIARGGWPMLVLAPADPGDPVQRRLVRRRRHAGAAVAVHVDDGGGRDPADRAHRAARRAPAVPQPRGPGAVGRAGRRAGAGVARPARGPAAARYGVSQSRSCA